MIEFPKQGAPKDSEPTLKVETLSCSSCGGKIDGPGKCPFCGQFLIVVEGGNYLRITPKDIEGIEIKKPSNPEGSWKFKITGKFQDILLSEEDIWIIGNGNIEFGGLLVALFFKNNSDKYGIPGQLRPKVEDIRAFAIRAAFRQSAARNNPRK